MRRAGVSPGKPENGGYIQILLQIILDLLPGQSGIPASAEQTGIDWGFNAWGGLHDGLYFPWDKDNRMARKLCDLLDKDVYNKRE